MSEERMPAGTQDRLAFEELLVELSNDPSPRREIVIEFFKKFLKASFFVPRRNQSVEFKNSTQYPNQFSDLLGVTSEEHTFVPIFSSEEEITEWFANPPLDTIEIIGSELCRRTPENWWISLNPGSEAGKEFSPWEIARLTLGTEEDLNEVVHEILSDEVQPVHFRALEESEKALLNEHLVPVFPTFTEVLSLYSGIQISEDGDKFIFGVLTAPSITEDEKERFKLAVGKALIGNSEFEIIFGTSLEDAPTLALFKVSKPFYTKNSEAENAPWKNFLQKIKKPFSNS